MSLETVLGIIAANGEQTIRQLRADSERRVQSTLEETRVHAEKAGNEWIVKRETEAYAESTRILQHARREAVSIQQQIQGQIIDAALQTLRERLSGLRDRDDYRAILAYLIIEAFDLLSPALKSGEQPCMDADPRDKALINILLDSPEFALRAGEPAVHYTLNCAGGINLSSADGRIVVHNTLDHRFEQAIPDIGRYVASLFEDAVVPEASL